MPALLWKLVWPFLGWLSNSTLRHISQKTENRSSYKNLYTSVDSRVVHHNPNVHQLIDGHKICYIHAYYYKLYLYILFCLEREWIKFWYKLQQDEPWKYYSFSYSHKWKEPETRLCVTWSHLEEISSRAKSIKTEDRFVKSKTENSCWGLRERGFGMWYLSIRNFFLWW